MKFSLPTLSLALLFSVATVTSCKKEKDTEPLYIVSGESNSEMLPIVNPTAVASLSGIYNPGSKKIAYNITWANLSSDATKLSFFLEGANQTATLFHTIDIKETGTKGTLGSHFFLNEAETEWLLGQKWCYTISSANHAEGEVRGRISVAW